jgi:hypothetical protein
MIRSVLAVAVGLAPNGLLALLSGLLMASLSESTKIPASPAITRLGAVCLVLAVAYAAAGGWLCGRIARRRPARHLAALIVWGELLLAFSLVAFWSAQPAWYGFGSMAAFAPAAFLGGRAAMAQATHHETDVSAGRRK